ncbi:MAG: VIT family protein [Promethearchaeota archaeon]|nr:MAG: VIT family protein [Candidatus Lokiarchaeota archaeon]
MNEFVGNEEHIEGGGKIRSFILGFNDGLISVFTLLVGVAAATLNEGNYTVILTGVAAMVSGAISMGLGEYISSKSEAKYIKNELERERAEIKLFPDEEKDEVRQIMKKWGFKGELLEKSVDQIVADEGAWVDFLNKSELGLEEPGSPAIGALVTFLSFIMGSVISLFPYFIDLGIVSLILSSVISFTMLFVVGAAKVKITGESPWKSGIEMVIVGIIAFIASYGIGLWVDMILPSN